MNSINLNELTLENIGQWPMVVKAVVVTVLVLVIFGLGYWFLIKTDFEQYDVLVAQETTLKSEFKTKQHQASNLNAYRNQLQIMTERFGAMLKKLPAKNEMPGLLEEISKTGVASGLKFESFAPQKEVKHDFYIELPIKITVDASYFQLALFLSRVAQMHRIVTLHDFSVEPFISKEDRKQSSDELVMNITAKIYRYRARQ